MKTVNFNSISIEGFRSYSKPIAFKFQNAGLYLVTGENGAGKTTLFSALVWCLFKINLNDSNNAAVQTYTHLRDADYKGTRVRVVFNTAKFKYQIVRHLNYKATTFGIKGNDSLMIFRKPIEDTGKFTADHMVGEELYKGDQQKFINRVIGLTGKATINSIIFGQRMARLVSAEGKEKRELFEELFSIDFVEKAKNKAAAKQVEITTAISNYTIARDKKITERNNIEDRYITCQETVDNFESAKQERLNAHKRKHKSVRAEIERLQADLSKQSKPKDDKKPAVSLSTLSSNLIDKQNLYTSAANKVRDLEQTIAGVDRAIHEQDKNAVSLSADLREIKDTCSLCGQPLKAAELKKAKESLRKKIEACDKQKLALQRSREPYGRQLADAKAKLQVIADSVKEAQAKFDAAKEKVNKASDNTIGVLQGRIKALQDQLPGIKADYNKEKAAKAPEYPFQKMEADVAKLNTDIDELDHNILFKEAELKKVLWWINKGFSAKGLKAYVFSAMLEQLNACSLKYSAYFGYSIRFSIDMSKDSKPFVTKIYRDGIERDYTDLSGGQKQRVDICLAFSMFDLVSMNTNINLMVLDEIFEGLNKQGVELVNMIIAAKAKEKAVYVITHNPMFTATPDAIIEISGGDEDKPSKIE